MTSQRIFVAVDFSTDTALEGSSVGTVRVAYVLRKAVVIDVRARAQVTMKRLQSGGSNTLADNLEA